MKPRVAVLIYSLAAGGAERVVSLLLPELTKHYEVTLLLMNDTLFYPVPERVEIRYLERSRSDEPGWKKLLKLPWLAWKLRRHCRAGRIDLVLSFMTRPNYVNALARILGSTAATLLSERSLPSRQYGYGGWSSRINRFLIRLLYPRADLIVTNAEGNRLDLQERFGLAGDKLVAIPNPIDVRHIAKLSRERRPEIDGEEGFVFVTVGRLDTGKNQRLLIEALDRLDAEDARLWIVGEGPLMPQLRREARRRGLEERVRFWGRQTNPFALMGRADCFCFASRHEGFPNVLLEALACGLPVVSTDCVSGPREILDERTDYGQALPPLWEGRYGILTAVDDPDAMAEAMQKVYNDDHIRDRYAGRAIERAREYDRERILPRYLRLIDTYLPRKGSRS